MTFKQNLGCLYFILPFIFSVDNKFGLAFSILIGSSTLKVKIQNQIILFHKSRFTTLLYLLGCLTYAYSYLLDSKKTLKISFDANNEFEISLQNLTLENRNLIELLYFGNKYGANFYTKNIPKNQTREKTFKISSIDNKRIITTQNGISFFIEYIHPGNTILETFIQKIHLIDSDINWEQKTVVDIGAECGDTPLYFASLGANVFAFEALKKHYDYMLNNLELNEQLSKKIKAINVAIGKDGPLKFFVSSDNDDGGTLGASFVYNNQDSKFQYENVTGLQLSSARKKFQIGHIDLLKMDCKGCEFFLTDDDLKDIDMIKIEYSIHDKNHKSENLLKLLNQNGFKTMIYRTSDSVRVSNFTNGTIFGSRI